MRIATIIRHCKSPAMVVATMFICFQVQVQAQYYEPGYLRYKDHVYADHIQTVLLHREGWELSNPWLEMGSQDQLRLSFDDLRAGVINYKYRYIHCNANWQPSDLLPADYLEGFYEDDIITYLPSYNTIQDYTHYTVVFPSERMAPTLSGNYLLIVYEAADPDHPVITLRFMIFESLVNIQGRVHAATDINERDYRQEIDFRIEQGGYIIEQPYRDMQVILLQNERWDNAITNLKPLMVRDRILDFNLDFGNVFDGGNEFRHFDIKSLRFNSDRIAQITDPSGVFEVILHPDIRRPFQVYTRLQDINGRRFIRNDNGSDSRVEAEYVRVHFTLPYEAPIAHGDIFVFGALTQWQFLPSAKMQYDFTRRAYRTSLYLKQGYYNYMYMLVEEGKTMGDQGFIEGNHEETENDYVIMVYNRETGSRYDRLIGLKQLNSLKDR